MRVTPLLRRKSMWALGFIVMLAFAGFGDRLLWQRLSRGSKIPVMSLWSAPGPRMRIMVMQHDDNAETPEDHRFADFIHINQEYCRCQGYEHKFVGKGDPLSLNISSYWLKPFITQALMRDHPELDAIAVLDTDAVVHRHNMRFEQLLDLYSGFAFIGAPDPPWFNKQYNAGVYFVRNNERGREIIDKWVGMYEPKLWTKPDHRWRCTMPGGEGCKHGEVKFEQGAFRDFILNEQAYEDDVVIVNRIINGANWNHSFIMHFAGRHGKTMVQPYLERRRKELGVEDS